MRCVILTELFVILLLTLLNGVFAGIETAVLSVRESRLRQLVEDGSTRAETVLSLHKNREHFFATAQVGITVAGAASAAFGGSSITARLEPWIADIPQLASWSHEIAFAIVVGSISYLSIVLGELVPKSLANRYPESYALNLGPMIAGLGWFTSPITWVLRASSNLLLRPFGDETSFTESRMSAEEVRHIVDTAASAGSVDPAVGEIATRALDFSDLDASMVMLPSSRIVRVPKQVSADELAAVMQSRSHARVLVYDGDPDNIIGALPVREALARALHEPGSDLMKLLRDVPFVPETMPAPALLRLLQHGRTRIAVVVDENGGVRGLVSVEDLLEELVGEILNETDTAAPLVHVEADGAILVEASRGVHEINRDAEIELPEGETFATIAGLVLALADRIPAVGERFETENGYELEVVEGTRRQVKRVRIRRAPHPEA